MSVKVIVGMSGGVDSSVAALLLKEEGYDVEGLFMKNWEEDDTNGFCAAEADFIDAKSVANQLQIPIHSVNFSKAYWDRVFSYFLKEYEAGRTPNPDVLCNKEIKFKAFLDYALTLGADFIATGHYAKVQNGQLFKAKDRDKDQSYFLHAIDKNALAKTLFPIGSYLKSEIRQIAKDANLITHNKKDSTGICFIGEKRFKSFLNEFILANPGDMVSTNGQKLGRHDGLMFYTLGQRQGLKIGGQPGLDDAPWYVVDKDIPNNKLLVAQGPGHPMLYAQGLMSGKIHWLTETDEAHEKHLPLTCFAKTRYRQPDIACVISPVNADEQHCVMFADKQRAVTPGQYIVFYDKNLCLGGAVIEEIIR